MLGNRELVLDTFCEVYDLLKPYMDFEFWEFANHTPIKDAIYLLGRKQFADNVQRIRDLVNEKYCHIILSNPAEGSDTLRMHCCRYGVEDLVKQQRILLIGGGEMDPDWPCLTYDSFLPKALDYPENLPAINKADNIYLTFNKP